MSSNCQRQEPDPDICGVGIRISFYLQNFVLVLLVNRSWEDAPNSLWTFIATNFGLTVAALVQLTSNELTLFEAIEVSYLVWLANFGTVLALASYSGQKRSNNRKASDTATPKHDNFVMVGAVVQMFFSMILTLVMWISASEIGNLPEQQCSNEHIRFVIFGAPVHALTTGRTISLVFISLISLTYIHTTYKELMASKRARNTLKALQNTFLSGSRKRPDDSPTDVPELDINLAPTQHRSNVPFSQRSHHRVQTPSLPIISETTAQDTVSGSYNHNTPGNHEETSSSSSGRPRHTGQRHRPKPKKRKRRSAFLRRNKGRKRWVNSDKMLIGTIAIQFLVFTYFIVCNELYINVYNNSDGENTKWGFGQVFALIVIIPSIVSVIRAFRKHGLSRLNRREPQRTREPGNSV